MCAKKKPRTLKELKAAITNQTALIKGRLLHGRIFLRKTRNLSFFKTAVIWVMSFKKRNIMYFYIKWYNVNFIFVQINIV